MFHPNANNIEEMEEKYQKSHTTSHLHRCRHILSFEILGYSGTVFLTNLARKSIIKNELLNFLNIVLKRKVQEKDAPWGIRQIWYECIRKMKLPVLVPGLN